jgi:putative transcriptional regulator
MKKSRLFDRSEEGLKEGIEFAQGIMTLATIELPAPPPKFGASDVVRLRRRLQMSQGVFAQVINVSAKTVQNWEHGTRKPSHASLRLLQIVAAQPTIVRSILGLRAT